MHKYAIDAKQLGDESALPWTNLGLWQHTTVYKVACQNLAQHLAQSLNLQAHDVLLDLGCGQGASLALWQNVYQLRHIEAVELQPQCIEKIKKQHLPALKNIYCHSFLALQEFKFKQKFDVMMCIDALYHHNLRKFLNSVQKHLNTNGRLGFHYLVLSDKWNKISFLKQQQYRYLLKCADININNLMTQSTLEELIKNQGYKHVMLENLTEDVFKGFSDFVAQHSIQNFKIKMTAKLCQKLYSEDLIYYVQVIAH